MPILGSLVLGAIFASISASVDSHEHESSARVSFSELVVVSTVKNGRTDEKLLAKFDVNNTGADAVAFDGISSGKLITLQFGMEAKIEYKLPGPSEVWQPTVGAGRDGAPLPDQQVVDPSEVGSVYVEWPLALLVEYPAETEFRVSLVDSKLSTHLSLPFKFHNGMQKLRYVYTSARE